MRADEPRAAHAATIQRARLVVAGVALIASILVPIQTSPDLVFGFDSGLRWDLMIWPLIAGGAYLVIALAPPNVPRAVLPWIPFGVSFAGICMLSAAGSVGAHDTIHQIGYVTVIIGVLIGRIARPGDGSARIVIAVGAGMLIPGWIQMLDYLFPLSDRPTLAIIYALIDFVVTLVAIACLLVSSFSRLVVAGLILWLPLQVVLLGFAHLVHYKMGSGAFWMATHVLVQLIAYLGVLIMATELCFRPCANVASSSKSACSSWYRARS